MFYNVILSLFNSFFIGIVQSIRRFVGSLRFGDRLRVEAAETGAEVLYVIIIVIFLL